MVSIWPRFALTSKTGSQGQNRPSWSLVKQRRLRKNDVLIRVLNAQHQTPGMRKLKQQFERRYILNNAPHLFDEAYYLDENPDLHGVRGGPLAHWIRHGCHEDRNPHPLFNTAYYRGQFRRFPKFVNPLVHFMLVGRRREQSPTRWFKYDTYRTSNPDVAAAKIEAFDHFVKYGVFENRKSCDEFDAEFYLSRYEDVRRSRMPALFHFLKTGREEGRTGLMRGISGGVFADAETGPAYDPREERRHALAQLLELPARWVDGAKVDVIIPVYRDFYLTLACIQNAVSMPNTTPFEVVVVDDCSPEPEIRGALQALAKIGLITLISHEQNFGFVKSVNDGMKLHPERDVVLLNSDAEVYGDWLDRLRQTAYAEEDIGTVSPLTNSGTICSYPRFCSDNSIPSDMDVREVDRSLARLNGGQYVEAPTAVGFCMYVKRAALNDVGYFDEASFGTGYGEENDFSLRAQAMGWRDVITTDTFVHHLGSASFLGEKAERVANALKVINARYPGYDARIQAYIKSDPLQPFRARLDMERLVRLMGQRNMIVVSHARGGGTEQHIRERIAKLDAEGWSVFRLHADPLDRNCARLFHSKSTVFPNLPSFDLLTEDGCGKFESMMRELKIERFDIHHLGDFGGRVTPALTTILKSMGTPYDFTVHDYMTICPRINLADAEGMYCGEPDAAGCRQCLSRQGSDWGEPSISSWRRRHADFLGAANLIVVPNADVSRRLESYFPDLAFSIRPHDVVEANPPIEPADGLPVHHPERPFRVGTLGAISKIKGLSVIRRCARHAQQSRSEIDFVVVGFTSNDNESRRAGLEITGPYSNDHVLEKIREARLDAIFLPSTWPETYSYTLSIAMLTGLPIIAFDIGAIADRVRQGGVDALLVPLDLAGNPGELIATIERYVTSKSD